MTPTFISLSELLEIHRDQVGRYGGDSGIRDFGLLQSALAMPASGLGGRYLHENLYEMAAAYLFHIIQNHPFVDGNKRTGVVAALIFLSLNGVGVNADENDFENLVVSVAAGKTDKKSVTAFFRGHAV